MNGYLHLALFVAAGAAASLSLFDSARTFMVYARLRGIRGGRL